MNMQTIIEKYKNELNENMFNHCNLFVTIGQGNESPRWYNFKDIDENNTLTIGSTQNSGLYFSIQLEGIEWMHVQNSIDEFWQAFKEYRTDFLSTNYPTIKL